MKSSMKSIDPRKFLIALLVLTLVSAGSYAQNSPFHMGLKVGTDLFKVTGRSLSEKTKAGLSAGVYGEYKLSRMWFVQSELLFNQAFTTTTDNFNQIYPGAIASDVTLNYITLPVMIAFKPVPELSILLGGQYGYLVNQTTGLLPYNGNKEAFAKSDVGIVFGGQLNLGKIKVGARYVINLNDINGINSSDTWRYHGFQFHVGYQLF
jgi:hypothetical protein